MRGYEAQLAVSRAPAVTRTEASAGFGRSLSWARAATAGETAGGPSLAVHALGDTVCQTSPTAHVLARMQGRAFSRQQPPRASIDETGRGHASAHDRVRRGDTLPPLTWWDGAERCDGVTLEGGAAPGAERCGAGLSARAASAAAASAGSD